MFDLSALSIFLLWLSIIEIIVMHIETAVLRFQRQKVLQNVICMRSNSVHMCFWIRCMCVNVLYTAHVWLYYKSIKREYIHSFCYVLLLATVSAALVAQQRRKRTATRRCEQEQNRQSIPDIFCLIYPFHFESHHSCEHQPFFSGFYLLF